MFKLNKLKAIVATGLMVLGVFAALMPAVMAQGPRATTGEALPSWDVNNQWKYRYDDTELKGYKYFGGTAQDGTYTIKEDMNMTPADHSITRLWTCTQVNKASSEYKMTQTSYSSENGTYKQIIVDNGGDPNPQTAKGTVIATGNYNTVETMNGEFYIDMNSLNTKHDTAQISLKTTAGTGNGAWTLTETDSIQDSNAGTDNQFKPTWNTAPMKAGDSWPQTNKATEVDAYDESLSGTWSGGGKGTITQEITYNYNWDVGSPAKKTITYTGGQVSFNNGYPITLRAGSSYDWKVSDDQGHSNNGHYNMGTYELWYGGDGDTFDCGWAIEYNHTTHITYCSYIAFQDTPPKLNTDAPTAVTINSDQTWNFGNGTNFTVTPGAFGQVSYSIKSKSLGANSNVLKDLTITSDTGQITYQPTIKDVADHYTVVINVTDNYPKGPMGFDYTIDLTIKDSNHAPTFNTGVWSDFSLQEGATNTPSWKLSDVFHDQDMDPNPLMSNAPYDAKQKLVFSVASNQSIRVLCNGNDMISGNQCPSSGLSFQAIDGKFPNPSIPVMMTITATDTGTPAKKVSGTLTVTVTHVNHKPTPVKAKQTFTMKEGDQQTIDLKTWFKDIDVGDSTYQTGDVLSFDHDGEKHISVTITGTKAKLWFDTSTDKLANHWNGQEDITFIATDKAGAKSDAVTATIVVTPVDDAPFLQTVNPTTDPSIYETDDGTEGGHPGTQKLTVTATDYDNTVGVNQNEQLSYNWTVEDDAQDQYKVDSHENVYTFTAAFDCDFANGKFCGETKYGDTSRTYYVTAHVTDGTHDVELHKWYVTVKDVPRKPTISGIEVFTVSGAGRTALVASGPGNYSLKYGSVIEFDVTNMITAPDLGIANGQGTANIDKLTFEWSSNRAGSLGQAAKVDVGAGKKGGVATVFLSGGQTHIITVRVSQGSLSATYAITVKVNPQPKTGIPGFESVVFVLSVVVAVAVIAIRRRK